MERSWRPGDRVTSVAVRGLGEGIVLEPHFHGVTVLWSDGTRSLERLKDLIYLGREGDPGDAPEVEASQTFNAPPAWAYGSWSGPVEGTEVDTAAGTPFGSFQDFTRERQRMINLYDTAFQNMRQETLADLTCAAQDATYGRIEAQFRTLGVDLACSRPAPGEWRSVREESIGPYTLRALVSPEAYSGYEAGVGEQAAGGFGGQGINKFGLEIELSRPDRSMIASDRVLEDTYFQRQMELYQECLDRLRTIVDPRQGLTAAAFALISHRPLGDTTIDHSWSPGDVVNVSRPGQRSGALLTGHILRVHTSTATVEWPPTPDNPFGIQTEERLERLIFVTHDADWLEAKRTQSPRDARRMTVTGTLASETGPPTLHHYDRTIRFPRPSGPIDPVFGPQVDWGMMPPDPQDPESFPPASATMGPTEAQADAAAGGPKPPWLGLVQSMPGIIGPNAFEPLPRTFDMTHRFGFTLADGVASDFV